MDRKTATMGVMKLVAQNKLTLPALMALAVRTAETREAAMSALVAQVMKWTTPREPAGRYTPPLS